jgi:hypothetical protein
MRNSYLVYMKNKHFITSKCVICEQVRSAEDKIIYAKRKKYIQDRFRTETGLLVDVVV